MLKHDEIWTAVDRLARSFGYSPSGLARQAGLDPTAFNKSKRFAPDGKPRWPSTESISRILAATGATMSDFLALIEDESGQGDHTVPVIGFAQAGRGGYFDEQGYPAGGAWDEVNLPQIQTRDKNLYALKIQGDSMEPLYRKNDVLVVSPGATVRKGDRIILKTTDGEVLAKELLKQNNKEITVRSLNKDYNDITVPQSQVAWLGRIVWVSQ